MVGMTSDELVHKVASEQHNLIARRQALTSGMSEGAIGDRVRSGRWCAVFEGVYLIGLGPPSWVQRAHAACLAAGEGAALSYRGAAGLMGLDGCSRGPIEITVPYGRRSAPAGVIAHRSRLLLPTEVGLWTGIPVTRVERTLTEIGRYVPLVVVEKAFEYSLRRHLTTETSVARYYADMGQRLRGARKMEMLLARRGEGPAAGSAAEVELLALLHEFGVEPPVRQYRIDLGGGWSATVDFAWPHRRFAAEWDGGDVHGGAALAYDLERQNAILDAGWSLRRFTAGMTRDRSGVAKQIVHALNMAPVR